MQCTLTWSPVCESYLCLDRAIHPRSWTQRSSPVSPALTRLGFLIQCLLALGQQSQTYSDCQQKTVAKKSIKVGRSSLTQIFPLRSLKTNPDAAAHRLLSLKHGKWNMSDSLEFWTMSEETGCEEKISTEPFCSRNDGLKGELATNTPQSPLAHLPQPKILTAEQIASQIRAKLPLIL